MNNNIYKITPFVQITKRYLKLGSWQIAFVLIILSETFTLAAADCQATLQWDPNTDGGTVGYQLFQRQENSPYNYAGPVYDGLNNQFTIDNLDEGAVYYFVVRAYDSADNMSGDSNEVRFSCDTNPPEVPELVNPENGAVQVSLEPMLATGPFYDPDATDNHTRTQWQIFRDEDSLCLFDMTSDTFLTDYQLPPLILDGATSYYWTARHFNQNLEGSPAADNAVFATATDLDDDNTNGIPDSQEVPVGEVIPGSDRTDLKCFKAASGDMNLGVRVSGNGSAANLIGARAVSPDRLDIAASSNANLPIGLIGYKLEVAQPADTASMTIYFSDAIPANQDWLYYKPAGYARIHNSISTSDRKSVTLQLQDGGDGDMDGVANGIIVGLSGYGGSSEDSTSTGLNDSSSKTSLSDEATGCFIDTLAGR